MKVDTLDPNALEQADIVLDLCGRPVPSAGKWFVDLPYVMPLHNQFAAPLTSTLQQRLANATNGFFICKGIVFQNQNGTGTSGFCVRVKWPSGRYLQQNPGADPDVILVPGSPFGTGGNLFALNAPEMVPPGAKIAVEISSPSHSSTGPVDLQFWGVLRYYMDKSGSGKVPRQILNPVDVLESIPRYRCGPPQNIMAPEFFLGNQCTPEVPPGYEDESFTFFSPAIVCPVAQQVFDTNVVIPGGQDVVVKRVRAICDFTQLEGAGTSYLPVFAMRLPSGYSLTGGDMVPAPVLYWWPWQPTVRIPTGQRIIIDMGDTNSTGASGQVITTFEFDAVKRRRKRG